MIVRFRTSNAFGTQKVSTPMNALAESSAMPGFPEAIIRESKVSAHKTLNNNKL